MRATTGTWPQYSTPCAANLMSELSSSGMTTKQKGAGPPSLDDRTFELEVHQPHAASIAQREAVSLSAARRTH
jgi:hypothetical protein